MWAPLRPRPRRHKSTHTKAAKEVGTTDNKIEEIRKTEGNELKEKRLLSLSNAEILQLYNRKWNKA